MQLNLLNAKNPYFESNNFSKQCEQVQRTDLNDLFHQTHWLIHSQIGLNDLFTKAIEQLTNSLNVRWLRKLNVLQLKKTHLHQFVNTFTANTTQPNTEKTCKYSQCK